MFIRETFHPVLVILYAVYLISIGCNLKGAVQYC